MGGVSWDGGGSRDNQHAHFRARLRRKISHFYQMYRRRRRPKKNHNFVFVIAISKGFLRRRRAQKTHDLTLGVGEKRRRRLIFGTF